MRAIYEDLIVPIVFIILLLAAAIAPIVGLAYWTGSVTCSTYEHVTGKPTKYAMMTCYISDGGQWYHWEEYKLRNATAGAAK